MRIKLIFISVSLWISTLAGQSGISMYTDIKAHNVGDVITVLIMENASAKQASNVNARANASVSADGSVAGTFAQFLPVFGASSVISSDVDHSNDSKQEDRLSGKISATIIDKTEAGLLKIKGERTVEVNGEENVMKLEGLVRAKDIRTDNTILSYNIADAQIIYRQAGLVNAMASPATISKTIAVTLALGLLGLAVSGVGL